IGDRAGGEDVHVVLGERMPWLVYSEGDTTIYLMLDSVEGKSNGGLPWMLVGAVLALVGLAGAALWYWRVWTVPPYVRKMRKRRRMRRKGP
ncbi:MAG: hypothetical protein J7L61_01525, partial [Thermoplasmata archaeon]|nr:hypothetical protein [Thermoplasmata archaeon]